MRTLTNCNIVLIKFLERAISLVPHEPSTPRAGRPLFNVSSRSRIPRELPTPGIDSTWLAQGTAWPRSRWGQFVCQAGFRGSPPTILQALQEQVGTVRWGFPHPEVQLGGLGKKHWGKINVFSVSFMPS